MLRRVAPFFLAGATLGGLAGCSGKSDPSPCPQPEPSFARDITPLLDNDCNTCHTPGSMLWPLVGYEDVRDWSYLILEDVEGGTMPPIDGGTPLSSRDRALLLDWIHCGAPNN